MKPTKTVTQRRTRFHKTWYRLGKGRYYETTEIEAEVDLFRGTIEVTDKTRWVHEPDETPDDD
jgi:hypothetical protein